MKNKVSFKKFEENVRKALQYVKNYQTARWVICDLAIEVCDVSHGGRKNPSVFSISKFAQEIGMDRKTLYEWIRVKRLVYDKLPKSIKENIKKYSYQDIAETASFVSEESSPKQVHDSFKTVLGQDPTSKKFVKYGRVLKSVLFNASRPILMKDVPRESIDSMMADLKMIVGLFEREISIREKYGDNSTSANYERLNIKAELEKRMAK